jgi:putative two-component system response regulator
LITKILIVDDEEYIREELLETINEEGYKCCEAANGEEALNILRSDNEITIVLTDIQMPGKNGIEMIREAKQESCKNRNVEFIIMTGHGGSAEAISALKLGVLDFLVKPIDIEHLCHVIRRAEELIILRRTKEHYQASLEADVYAKTIEVRNLLKNVEDAYDEALKCLAVAAEFKDPETGHHIQRIGEFSKFMAKQLGWSEERQHMMLLAAPLHDVGKIGTPEIVLLKPGKLDPDEVAIMKEHSQNGYNILSHAEHSVMKMAATIARNHHERWNGGGYPRGLKGTEIPIEARIVAVVDVYDALRSKRPYKAEFDQEKTLSIMLDGDGRTDPSHFDPQMLDIFRNNSEQFDAIYKDLAD